MNPKFAIFTVIGTLVVMALYCSSTNFVSAATECYGASLDHYFCSVTEDLGDRVLSFVMECIKDKNGLADCHALNEKVPPPGIEDAIKKSVMPEVLGKSTK